MNKGEILVAIHNMRDKSVYEANAEVVILDELLEKIANTPDDTGEVKHNAK